MAQSVGWNYQKSRVKEAMIEIKAENISKAYSYKINIFKDVTLHLKSGDSLSITGRNGSGKSTLLKTIAGLISHSTGKIEYSLDNKIIPNTEFNTHYGILTPYLNIYEEFTPLEILRLTNQIRGMAIDENLNLELLEKVGLIARKDDKVSEFSSGMKQRMKLCLAFCHKPKVLFLDEPFTNLDTSGIAVVKSLVSEFKAANGLLIIATNDENEKELCEHNLELNI